MVPSLLFAHLIDQAWHRVLAQHSCVLTRSRSRDEGYGEMLPGFVDTMIREDVSKHISLDCSLAMFLDIGSGVGNIAAQVSMITGCLSLGFEIVRARHKLSRPFLHELDERLAAWGLPKVSPKVELPCLDIFATKNRPRLIKAVQAADVIYANNRVFDEKSKSYTTSPWFMLRTFIIIINR
jgi:[histone H3]-lysine79 N-trimethyltransferase